MSNSTSFSLSPSINFGFEVEHKGATKGLMLQKHTNIVIEVGDAADRARQQADPAVADAVWTREPDSEVFCFTADCVPVLIYSTRAEGGVAAVHAGWRGAAAGVVSHTLAAMQQGLSSNSSASNSSTSRQQPRNGDVVYDACLEGVIGVVIGPCIRGCCYEVQDDFIAHFARFGYDITTDITVREGKKFFDLPSFLLKTSFSSLKADQVLLDYAQCTFCSQPRLPSYRRNGTTDPHIRSWIKKVSHAS